MENAKSDRRRLLQIAAAGGVLSAHQTLPQAWVKPLVQQVSLPAHATVTPLSRCGPTTASDESQSGSSGDDLDRLLLYFDGEDCQMEIRDNLLGLDTDTLPDLVIVLDVDSDGTVYEIQRAGSNDWSIDVSPQMGLTDPDLDFTATRQTGPDAGSEFDVEIDIELDPPEMTCTVQIFPSPTPP